MANNKIDIVISTQKRRIKSSHRNFTFDRVDICVLCVFVCSCDITNASKGSKCNVTIKKALPAS